MTSETSMSSVFSPAGFAGRRRAPQRQQQPERFALNLQQQQQGSSEYQQGQGLRADMAEPDAALVQRRAAMAREGTGEGARAGMTGGQGGTPLRLPERGTHGPREARSYIREASVNIDA